MHGQFYVTLLVPLRFIFWGNERNSRACYPSDGSCFKLDYSKNNESYCTRPGVSSVYPLVKVFRQVYFSVTTRWNSIELHTNVSHHTLTPHTMFHNDLHFDGIMPLCGLQEILEKIFMFISVKSV